MTTSSTENPPDTFEEMLRRAEDAAADLRYQEALRHVLEALKLAEEQQDALRQSRAHAEHSRVLCKLSLLADAVTAAHAALRLAQDDPVCGARALGVLGTANQALLPPEAHFAFYESMLEKARQAGHQGLEASAIRGICIAHLIQHQMAVMGGASADDPVVRSYADSALKYAREATRLCEVVGDAEQGNAYLSRHLQVGALIQLGDLTEARRESEAMLQAAAGLPRPD
ncbi:MAG TPA: hypothetical protein VNU71_20490, partial [Burkholderiaceae bacterium]|nr:hypothetical protein [Burkholderiaceae bacterium]